MSGSGKKVVELAKKASKGGIDWDGMGKLLVSDEARKEFSNLRRAFDEVNSQLQTKFSQVILDPTGKSPLLISIAFLGMLLFDSISWRFCGIRVL